MLRDGNMRRRASRPPTARGSGETLTYHMGLPNVRVQATKAPSCILRAPALKGIMPLKTLNTRVRRAMSVRASGVVGSRRAARRFFRKFGSSMSSWKLSIAYVLFRTAALMPPMSPMRCI